MKKLTLLLTFALLSVVSALKANAQFEHEHGPDCLGVWCSIDVHLATDPTEGRYASYSFPHPPEYLGPMQYNNGYPMYYDNTYFHIIGPGRPYITCDGGDPVLHLDLDNLKLEVGLMAEEQGNNPDYIETTVEFPVQKEAYQPFGHGGPYQCYYHIRLVVWINTY